MAKCYSTVKLLDKKQEIILPDSKTDKELANSFMTYFTDKIQKIRDTFKKSKQYDNAPHPVYIHIWRK